MRVISKLRISGRKVGFFGFLWVSLRFFEGFNGFLRRGKGLAWVFRVFEAKEGGYALEKVATWIMKGFYAMKEVQMHLEGG